MSFEVINSPIFTTIQDKGRFSFASIGVTTSGVMDEYAYMWANKLLSNSLDTNTLEISFSNLILKASKNTKISITGAICEFFINDELKRTWQTYDIKTNDIVKIGKIISGTRVYLCVKNGFKIKKEFLSNATTIKENLGGLNGDKLTKGDILNYDTFNQLCTFRTKDIFIPNYEEELTLRVILSYQENHFPKEEKDKLFSNQYTVTNDFNRMGCKLDGQTIACDIDGIISEGISYGAIQIPKDGKPIILLKDRQTIGGYPKIGSVLSIDCFKLAQLKPNSQIRFKEISIQKAQNKVKEFYKKI